MVMTPQRVRELSDEKLFGIDLARTGPATGGRTPVGPARPAAAWAPSRLLDARWTAAVAAAWVVGLPVAIAIEPQPATPAAPPPLWATAMALAMFVSLGALAGALLRRSRTALSWSAGATGLLAAGVAACPITAHHVGIGSWWAAQIGITAALGAVTAAAARRG